MMEPRGCARASRGVGGFPRAFGSFCTHIAEMPRALCLTRGSMSGFGQIWWHFHVPQPIPVPGCWSLPGAHPARGWELCWLRAGLDTAPGSAGSFPAMGAALPPAQPPHHHQCCCLSTSSFPPHSWSSPGSTYSTPSTFCWLWRELCPSSGLLLVLMIPAGSAEPVPLQWLA